MTLAAARSGARDAGRRQGELAERLQALDRVLELAPGRLDPELTQAASRLADRAGRRLRLGTEHTVAALAGATGSGKSSLFNALAGEALSPVGVLRPTTRQVQAAILGPAGPDPEPLLDWLGAAGRHRPARGAVGGGDPAPDGGLIVLDLPDLDSVHPEHRALAQRLLERVDLLVWVLDPQKYADGALHEAFLAPLAGHAAVSVVVLNQVDRLPAAGRAACVADLTRLLDADGLRGVPVLTASTRTGEGVAELRAELAARARARQGALARLAADLTGLGGDLATAAGCRAAGCRAAGGAAAARGGVARGGMVAGGGEVAAADRRALLTALATAAGVEQVAAAVAERHRWLAGRATGWPPLRWLRRLRPDPVRRLGLRERPSELLRTGLPGPTPVQQARLDVAVRALAAGAGRGLPEPWPTLLRRAAAAERERLPDLLDRAVAGADLDLRRRPRWWTALRWLQGALLAGTVAGLVWLGVLAALDWLRLPPPPTPGWGVLPVPTALAGGGALLGLLLALLAARLAAAGARRAARRVRRRIEARVEEVARGAVLEPVQAELDAHRALCAAVTRLTGPPAPGVR